ncbi:MAG TPA: hypothetical protein VL101_12985 [Nordella sp.]|nr:hypothetical protein [Nordella sp.]
MKILRLVLSVLGALMVLLGLIWIGQGSGYFPYPAESFMINQTPWIYWGLLVAAAGVVVLFISRKLARV